jgi:hypothetical protein
LQPMNALATCALSKKDAVLASRRAYDDVLAVAECCRGC